MVGCATNAGVTPVAGAAQEQTRSIAFSASGWVEKDGISFHIPHYMVTRQLAKSITQPDVTFSYGGGHVLVAPKVYLIIWGYAKSGDPDNVASLLQTYVSDMGGSGHNNIYTQYYEKSGGSTTNITNPGKQFGGVWDDNSDRVPTVPSDSQVARESLKGVAHFGYDPNGSYVVAIAHHHDPSGFGMVWCAYHSATIGGGKLVSYTNLPYQPDAGSSCGANTIRPPSDERGVDEGVTIVEGHEQGESVTDPNPPSGWHKGQYGEIGDICAWKNSKNDRVGSDSFTMQPMFSNATQSCVHSY
jgi:hypothetical protein